jgi:hypothetical protein
VPQHPRLIKPPRGTQRIERMFSRLKIIATCYDRGAASFLSTVHIATASYWLKFVHAA